MCYITYAVPVDELPDFPHIIKKEELPAPPAFLTGEAVSPEFMPEWFYAGGFPEDDVD